jgi:putative MATE family efflux protein
MNRWQRLWASILDREYYSRLYHFALPITIQQLIMSALNMVSTVMIGQLGEARIAAVGLSNQVFFLVNLLLFGANSGAAIFTAQYWGKGDIPNVRRILGLALSVGLTGTMGFVLAAELAPAAVLGVYSRDPEVIALGSSYLRLAGLSFIFNAISYSYVFILRSTGQVRLPMLTSISAIGLNAALSYVLIFGKLGLPALGINGAAIALVIVRGLECLALLAITYWKKLAPAATPAEMFSFNWAFAWRALQRIVPVMVNEIIWSFGITAYYVIYGRMGTGAVAAMNIAATIDGLFFVLFSGISNACAILVGNLIGAGEERKAFRYAGLSLGLALACALGVSGMLLLSSGAIIGLYKVSPEVALAARRVLMLVAGCVFIRAINTVLFVGVFRSGGDTKFAFFLDAGVIWAVGVPLAALGAFVFGFPVHLVYLMTLGDELTKATLGLARFASRRWIHNLTEVGAP